MEEPQPQPIFEIDLAEKGGLLVFKTFAELRQWNNDENSQWGWLNEAGRPMTDAYVNARSDFFNQLNSYAQQWQQYSANLQEVAQIHGRIRQTFNQHVLANYRLIVSTNPAASFIFDLRSKRGDKIAAGGYAALLGGQINTSGYTQAEFFEGIVEGFLFKREIDWSGQANQQVIDRLRAQYDGEIKRQNERFQQLEEKNSALNISFEAALKEKTDLLQKLHQDQTADYATLTKKHVDNLTAIEKTYDQKLALHKTVVYWKVKEQHHKKLAKNFGLITVVAMLLLGVGMGSAIYTVLTGLSDNENPKHWQLGILIIGLFFSIWIVRLLVRMFLSNLHLSEDAAERRTMILTYLSMSREGSQFEAKDKNLILQHLFRSASDGLVKDDAAPPSPLEALTRR
jgi:hypothetical protein